MPSLVILWPGCPVAIRRVGVLLVCASVLGFPPTTFAQATYTLIHRFKSGARIPMGRLAEAPDGSLYGTTYSGGEPNGLDYGGTIFALRPLPDGNRSFETVHQFRPGQDGANPVGGLTLGSDGDFYGIANRWGRPIGQQPVGAGTVFRMSPSGSFTTLYVFSNEDDPMWRLAEASDGNFYGSTCRGRYNDTSTIFRITPAGSLTTLHKFQNYVPPSREFNPIEGFCPITELREAADGFLYGDAAAGGPTYSQFPQYRGLGTLFRIDPRADDSPLTVLHAFHGLDGARPIGGLTPGSNGAFFGTTMGGGLFGKGLVYRRSASGSVQTVHTFRGTDGAFPWGSLFRSADGALYGTAAQGGTGFGTLFRIGASSFSTLHTFNGTDGSGPLEMMQARDGYFYGVTFQGGPRGSGTVYRLGPGNTVTTLHAFAAEPRQPKYGVIQGTDGNFYGTTSLSDLGGGAVFRLTPSGELTILHDFGSARVEPFGLIQATDGFLYGTTLYGGAHDRGMVFRIGTAGGLTVLHSFLDYVIAEALIQATDGTFYGTTQVFSRVIGGVLVYFPGTIFRMDASGNLETLYTFPPGPFSFAYSPLVQASDGDLYGVGSPGEHAAGMIFKITTSGAFTLLHSFSSDSEAGYVPVFGLTRASDGRLYGVTQRGGGRDSGGAGAIFRLDTSTAEVTTLRTFTQAEGGVFAGLLAGQDGAIYGIGGGGIFRLAATGFDYIYDPVEADGLGQSRLIAGVDGALYGTVQNGPNNLGLPESWPLDTFCGGVFRLTVPPLP